MGNILILVYARLMATLIVTVLFGSVIAYFATQNTSAVTINFLDYTVSGIPLYIVVVGALLVGLFIAWIISLVNSIGTIFAIRGSENTIKDYKKENAELTKQVHKLEVENAKLMAETNSSADDKSL